MNATEVFEALARTTCRLISYAHSRKIRLDEDAITTENLLLLDCLVAKSVVVEDTRVDEDSKGADWEFWIGNASSGWARYAVQAKRIDLTSARYKALGHKVNKRLQVDILESFAKANRAAPIYCLYNDYKNVVGTSNWNCNLASDPQQLGCSVTPSRTIQNALRKRGCRSFGYIHSCKETLPWRCLVKCPNVTAMQGSSQNPLAHPDINHYYDRLPDQLVALRETRDAETIHSDGSLFGVETKLRPRWIGVIDLGPRNIG